MGTWVRFWASRERGPGKGGRERGEDAERARGPSASGKPAAAFPPPLPVHAPASRALPRTPPSSPDFLEA